MTGQGEWLNDGGNQLQSRYFDELYHNLLSALDPWLMIPARCPACWERVELSRDEVISWVHDFWMREIWFWRCPHCDYEPTRDVSTPGIAA
jgi:uncharacterized protein with PIN domain